MVFPVPEDWNRLAQVVREHRELLGLTQTEAVARSEGAVSLATWRNIETGSRPPYRRSSLLAVSRVLGWAPESIEHIVTGGNPVPATTGDSSSVEERLERIQADLAWIREQLAGSGGESRSA